jgi:putative aldouronate transport system substrate-binding protein
MKISKIVLLLVLATTFVMMGCSKKETTLSGGAGVSSGTSPLGTPLNQAHPAKIDSPYMLPYFDPPQKFTFFWQLNPKATRTITDYSEMTLFQEYKRLFGFDFEFIHPPMDRQTEQFNLMRASGDFPDIVYWQNWTDIANGLESAFLEGLAIDLTPYMTPQNTPNFLKIINDNPEIPIRKTIMTDSGKYYGFPMLRFKLSVQAVWGFMIREDWVNKIGWKVEDIKTKDDLYKVLTLFKNSYINGDGKVVYPWMAKRAAELKYATLMWGISTDFYQKNGKIGWGPYDPEYRDAITTMAQWYKEGLIDPDYSTADIKTGDSLVLNNRSGFFWGESGGIAAMYMATWKDTQPNAVVVGIPTPNLIGDNIHYTNRNDLLWNGVAWLPTKNNKFPVETVRLMDWGYSREGQLLQNYGPEGTTYTMANGRPKLNEYVTNNSDGLSIDEAIARHALGSMSGPYVFDSDIREQRMLFFDWQRRSVAAWNSMTDIQLPKITLTVEENRRFSQLMGDINTYRDEMFDKFVMGKEPLSNLDAYYATLKRMGIEEAIALQQAGLDRFNAR